MKPSAQKLPLFFTHAFFLLLSATLVYSQSSLTLQVPRYGHASVASKEKIYVLGGSYQYGFLGDIVEIDPAQEKYKIIHNGLLPRRYHCATYADGKIYITSGIKMNRKPANLFEVYDIKTKKVTQLKNIPIARRFARSVLVDNIIYVIGGSDTGEKIKKPGSLLAFDLDSYSWNALPEMLTPRQTAVVAHQNKIYTIGGYNGGKTGTRHFEVFDIQKSTWEKLEDLPFPLSAHSAILDGDNIICFGDYKNLSRVVHYNIKSKKWQEIDSNYRASRHNTSLLLKDEVFVIGGNTNGKHSHLNYIQRFELKELQNKKPSQKSPLSTSIKNFFGRESSDF